MASEVAERGHGMGHKKPTARVEFVLFNVLYEDGTVTSNRKVSRRIAVRLGRGCPSTRLHRSARSRDPRALGSGACAHQIHQPRVLKAGGNYRLRRSCAVKPAPSARRYAALGRNGIVGATTSVIGTTTPGPNLEIFDSNAGARAATLQTRSSTCSATAKRSSTSSVGHTSVSARHRRGTDCP